MGTWSVFCAISHADIPHGPVKLCVIGPVNTDYGYEFSHVLDAVYDGYGRFDVQPCEGRSQLELYWQDEWETIWRCVGLEYMVIHPEVFDALTDVANQGWCTHFPPLEQLLLSCHYLGIPLKQTSLQFFPGQHGDRTVFETLKRVMKDL